MSKKEFLENLKERLSGLPDDELKSWLSFYEESIEDRVEEGKSEEEAVNELGSVDSIVEQIASQTTLFKLVKHRTKKEHNLKKWLLITLIATCVIWLPLLIAGIAVCAVLYVVFWIIGFLPGIACGASFGGSIVSIIFFFLSLHYGSANFGLLGLHFALAGLGLMLIPATYYLVIGYIKFTKTMAIKIKTSFITRSK